MSIYGEKYSQLRDVPARTRLLVVSAALYLIAAVLSPIILSLMETAIATWSGWSNAWVLYAPLASSYQSDFYSEQSLATLFRFEVPLVALGSIVLAVLMIHLWPTDQNLSNRLFIQSMAISVVSFGSIAPGFERKSFTVLQEAFGIDPLVSAMLAIATGAWAVLLAERRTNEILTNLYTIGTPAPRIGLWLLRIPLPAFAIAMLCTANTYWPGVWAWIVVAVATLLENVSHIPRKKFEQLNHAQLREAAITLPLVAVAALAGSVAMFGFGGPRLLRPSGAVLSTEDGVRLLPMRLIQSRYSHPPEPEADEKHPAEEETKLDIHWSGKGAASKGTGDSGTARKTKK